MRDSMALHASPRPLPSLHPPHMTGFQSRLDFSLRCSRSHYFWQVHVLLSQHGITIHTKPGLPAITTSLLSGGLFYMGKQIGEFRKDQVNSHYKHLPGGESEMVDTVVFRWFLCTVHHNYVFSFCFIIILNLIIKNKSTSLRFGVFTYYKQRTMKRSRIIIKT